MTIKRGMTIKQGMTIKRGITKVSKVSGHTCKRIFRVFERDIKGERENHRIYLTSTLSKYCDNFLQLHYFSLILGVVANQVDNGVIAIDDIVFSPDCLTHGRRVFPVIQRCIRKELYCKTNGNCISDKLKCNGKRDCKDGSDEGNCLVAKTKIVHNRVILHVGIILGLVLLIIVLLAGYCIIQRRRNGKLDLLSMLRHRGMSVAEESIRAGSVIAADNM